MHRNDFTEAQYFSVIVANTYDERHTPPEELKTNEDIYIFLTENGYKLSNITELEVQLFRDFRQAIRRIFTETDSKIQVEKVNRMLKNINVHPRIEETEIVFTSKDDHWLEVLKADVLLEMAKLVLEKGTERIKMCSATPCSDIFIDTTKNKKRRYCSGSCNSRFKVAAYRARQKSNE